MDLNTAALLNANDPERLRVEQDACQTPEGREAWLQAVQQAEQLRVHLKSVSATLDAVNKALRIAKHSSNHGRLPVYLGGMAAALLLTAGGWWLMAQQRSPQRIVAATFDQQVFRKIELAPQIKQLALLATKNFEERDKALTPASDMEALLVNLPGTDNLPTQVPKLGTLQQLTGGKVVTLDDKAALLTRWTETVTGGQTHNIALQQFYAAELKLPKDMTPVLVHIDPPGNEVKPPCDILLWTHEGVAYMLAARSSDGCARRALQALRQKLGSDYPVSPLI